MCATVAALALAACGGDDETTASTTTAASNPDVDRYCEVVTELDQNSADVFDELGEEGVPSEQQLVDAQLKVLNDNADLIAELQEVAPTEISDDLQLSIDSARERAEAGDPSQPPQDVVDAGLRLQEFRKDNCPKPSAG